MMATLDDRGEVRPVRLWAAVLRVVLSVLLALAALYGLVRVDGVVEALVALGHLWGPWAPQTTYLLAKHLLILLGGIGAILWLRPWQAVIAVGDFRDDEGNPATLDTAVMSAVLGLVALAGLSASAGVVGAVLFDPRIEHPVNWLTWAHLATLLLIAAGGIWGLARLKPWAGRETVSPATRKTNALFGIGGILATISCLAVVFDTIGRDGDPFGVWSNGPVTLWVAILAIVIWLIAWAVSWWWYVSADEHEQRASDVGLLAGGFLFTLVTPAWWITARAGLVPQPNAMILWFAVSVIWTIGWFWRRNR